VRISVPSPIERKHPSFERVRCRGLHVRAGLRGKDDSGTILPKMDLSSLFTPIIMLIAQGIESPGIHHKPRRR